VGFRAGLDESYRQKRNSAVGGGKGKKQRIPPKKDTDKDRDLSTNTPKQKQKSQENDENSEQNEGEGESEEMDRKPWGYWKDISQIKASVESFWAALNITSSTIPNEMLLRLYDAHG
jgi:hypothetical protein